MRFSDMDLDQSSVCDELTIPVCELVALRQASDPRDDVLGDVVVVLLDLNLLRRSNDEIGRMEET